jgi:hypothetical protein
MKSTSQRGSRLQAARTRASIRGLARSISRRVMYAFRPLLRRLVAWQPLRYAAVKLAGHDSWLVNRARQFLFGMPAMSTASGDGARALTHVASQVFAEIQLIRSAHPIATGPTRQPAEG